MIRKWEREYGNSKSFDHSLVSRSLCIGTTKKRDVRASLNASDLGPPIKTVLQPQNGQYGSPKQQQPTQLVAGQLNSRKCLWFYSNSTDHTAVVNPLSIPYVGLWMVNGTGFCKLLVQLTSIESIGGIIVKIFIWLLFRILWGLFLSLLCFSFFLLHCFHSISEVPNGQIVSLVHPQDYKFTVAHAPAATDIVFWVAC